MESRAAIVRCRMRSLKMASAVAATRCCEGSVYRAGTSVHTIVGTPASVAAVIKLANMFSNSSAAAASVSSASRIDCARPFSKPLVSIAQPPSTQITMWVTPAGNARTRLGRSTSGGWRTVSFQGLRGRGTSALSACPFPRSMFCNASPSSTRCRITSGELCSSSREFGVMSSSSGPDRVSYGRLVRLFPILSRSHVHDKRDLEVRHAAHQLRDLGLHASKLVLRRLEHQLVVYLHDELGGKPFAVEPTPHGDHRELDQVRGRALHWGVDRCALGPAAARRIGALDLRQPQAPAENGLDIATVARGLAHLLHVLCHPRIAGEVARDIGLRRGALQAELLRQTEGGHPVDQPEVDHLGVAALLGCDVFERAPEHLGSGGAVDVLARLERAQQILIPRDMRHDAQLDLRIICAHDGVE